MLWPECARPRSTRQPKFPEQIVVWLCGSGSYVSRTGGRGEKKIGRRNVKDELPLHMNVTDIDNILVSPLPSVLMHGGEQGEAPLLCLCCKF